MLSSIVRRTDQLVRDPVLRKWAVGRLVGREKRPPPFTPHRPPYLRNHPLPTNRQACAPKPATAFRSLAASPPTAPIVLDLPGEKVTLEPGAAATLFDRGFADIETLLAIHRFAWIPVMGEAADPGWVDALWRAWSSRYETVDRDWPWHPYTAAERAINILDFARRNGLPGDRSHTLALLATHGYAIANRLEYFGDHYTSNHLSNNGRGLFRLGLDLDIPDFTELGSRILLAEAARIFAPSGVLREGSSHYHLLLTRNYLDAWLAARAFQRPEADALEEVVRHALEVLPHVVLTGGMPLIGDISPDCPPQFLAGLLSAGNPETGWCGMLSAADRGALAVLKQDCRPVSPDRIAADGWTRFSAGPWSALCYAAPGGWPPMPGHGHQDMGGFELHHGPHRVFVDPGRGCYGQSGDAARYASAAVHNTLVVDGEDPYPPNRPYYDEKFRRRIGGNPPRVARERDGITLSHDGFARLGGVGAVQRRLAFDSSSFRIADRIEGESQRTVTRCLHTTLSVSRAPGGVMLESGEARFHLRAEEEIALSKATCWTSYGEGIPSTLIEISMRTRLPFESTLVLEAL